MDFARKILNKYGWRDGDGLGKNSDGIVKPIKARMKFDNAGLGADQAASDFNNHWWERVFNEASSNVAIKAAKNGTVAMELKNVDDSVEISTKGYSLKKLKKAKASCGGDAARYHNFLQSATLTKSGNEIENTEKITVADIAVTQYKALTDEELFQACGGRTAHKGARHGLKLSGKLSRLERQEQELLAKMQQKLKTVAAAETVALKKVKKSKCKNDAKAEAKEQLQEFNASAENDGVNNCEVYKTSKKKRKRDAVDAGMLETVVERADCTANDTPKQKKTKRKEKHSAASTAPVTEVCSRKSKKAKRSTKDS